MSDTEVQQLIIYVGTQAKIDEARQAGTIGPDDFAVVTDAPEFQTKLTSANAGTGISITEVGGVVKISNTQTSAEWGNIQGSIQTQTDLWNYLSQIGVLSSLSTTVKTDLVSAINELYGIANTALQPSDIINTTDSTATNKALSANMGKSLQDQIDNLSARGRFLALWNCATGLAQSNPPESPYTYKTGDYFIVCTVAEGSGTNYRPNGSTYTTGVASTTVETAEVSVDDVYYYDGENWRLQTNTQKTLAFQNIAGSPYDNTELASALNEKQDELSAGAGIDISNDTVTNTGVRGVSTGSTNGTISVNTNGTSAEVPVAGLGSAAYTPSTNYATSAQGTKADTALQGVQVGGTDLTPDANKKVNIPIASANNIGVAKINTVYGIGITSNGELRTYAATDAEIESKSNTAKPIVPSALNKAVMEGLGNNSLTWTDAYKTSARNTIGASRVSFVDWID